MLALVGFGENGSVAPFTLTLVATAGPRAAFGITVSSSASPCALIGATSGSTGTGMQVDGQKMEVAGKLMVAADADFGLSSRGGACPYLAKGAPRGASTVNLSRKHVKACSVKRATCL